MKTQLSGVRIAGIASSVPPTMRTVAETAAAAGISDSEAAKIVKMTGVRERYVAPADVCASDLSYAAAEQLLEDLQWDRDSIDALIFVSQTHDYDLPATACVLHDRLKLPTSCAAFDISLGCSGYIYGMWNAATLIVSGSAKRVLLLAGDTISKICSPQDRATAFIFGDAGTATALEHDENAAPMSFVLGTDGAGQEFLVRHGGGHRFDMTPEILNRQADDNGNVRGPLDLYMNGTEVFSFTLERVPPMIEAVLGQAGWTGDDLDFFVPHQANLFMLQHLAKRMKIPAAKLVVSLDEFGNTSCASIPLAIGHRLASQLRDGCVNLVMSGFGVGWSWGALAVSCGPMVVSEILNYDDDLEEDAG